MSMTFTKLFSSITESTIWIESANVRLVWITMLAMSDSKGRVWASVPGLANRARVPVEDVEDALHKFTSPDKYSRTPDNDGRRIEKIDGGWRLLNHAKYRALRDEEAIKESKRTYINTRRAKEKASTVEECRTQENVVPQSRANAEAESEADAKSSLTESAPPPSVEEVLKLEPDEPKAKKPRPDPPDPRREEFVEIFREYITAGGVTYDRPNAADNAQLKTLLNRKPDMTAEEWREYLLYIHENSRSQYAPGLLKDCGSLALVCSKIDRIQIFKDRNEKK